MMCRKLYLNGLLLLLKKTAYQVLLKKRGFHNPVAYKYQKDKFDIFNSNNIVNYSFGLHHRSHFSYSKQFFSYAVIKECTHSLKVSNAHYYKSLVIACLLSASSCTAVLSRCAGCIRHSLI